ncbi:MAG: hypothetical protein KAW12_20870 [Candidatus Aminicenantes bacterium]|nr:hypothetical protein [Candidatus Aminicenantes bacterium]
MIEAKRYKDKSIDCVKLQRDIREKIFEESKDKSLQEMVDQMNKGLSKNKIWTHLGEVGAKKKRTAVRENIIISKPGCESLQ